MDGLYTFVVIIFIVILISMVFLIWRVNVGITKTTGELRTTLENLQASAYAPLSILSNFFKSLSSLFHR